MASCITSQWSSAAPQAKLTVTQKSSDGDSVVLEWTLEYIAKSAASTNGNARPYTVIIDGETVKTGSYNINGVSGTKTIASGTKNINKGTSARNVSFSVSFAFNVTWSGTYGGTKTASGSISVAKKTSYTVAYNANGGSGAPSSQTKWYGTALTLSGTKPTRTGYSFQGWATSASGGVAYAAGASYTANAGATLYAVWKANTYSVKYNANGGTGAPANQTKTHGVTLVLSNAKPTRTNYTFKGWATSASATTATYAAGASYKNNAAATLYAVWELSYKKPIISNLSVTRFDDNGMISDDGENAKIKFTWESTDNVTAISVSWTPATNGVSSESIPASGKYGTIDRFIIYGLFDVETSYKFTVTVADGSSDDHSADRSVTMSGSEYHMDFGEHSVSVGKPAEPLLNDKGEIEKTFDVKWRSKFRNNVGIGDKLWYHDGQQGIFLSWEGFMHLQRTTAQGYHPYIGFYLDDATAANGQIRLNSGTKIMEFLSALGYKFGNDVQLATDLHFLKNNSALHGVDPNGIEKAVFIAQNKNGNTILGYDNYANASGDTNIYGNDINFGISNIATPGSFRPYRRRGDSFSLTLRTAGYVTNGGKDVSFWIPMAEPIVGSPTVTITSGDGFVFRQGAQYTHGSTASVYAKPSSYEAVATTFNGIYVKAVFSNTTNVINNDAIGIYWNGTITLS